MVKESKDTRRLLLDTAINLISRSSYNCVSVDDICKEANVKKGSFYHFFPSKHDLAYGAFLEHWNEISKKMDSIFSPIIPPFERIDNYCTAKYDFQKEALEKYGKVCGCAFASLAAEMATQDENFRKIAEDIHAKCLKYFESTLRDLSDLGYISKEDITERAKEINAYSLGVMMTAKMTNDIEVLNRDLRKGIYRILGITDKQKTTTKSKTKKIELTSQSTIN